MPYPPRRVSFCIPQKFHPPKELTMAPSSEPNVSNQKPVVAFLGLGNMGLPMAHNLVAAGYSVIGFDPTPTARAAAEADGLALAESAAAAAAASEVVISMLPSGQHVLDAYAEGAGIIGTVAPGSMLIDCSTIAVEDARTAHELAAAAGLHAIDAPVSGGVVGATAGTLTFMVGADDASFARAEPILSAMGARVVHCGAAGAGQAAKVCNNMVLAASMIAVSEAFVLAESLDLDHQALYDVLSTSSGSCWAVNVNCPVPGPVPTSPANREFTGGFATKLMVKDLRLALEAASLGSVDTPMGSQALSVYEAVLAEAPDLDFSVVIDSLRARRDDSA